MLLQHYQYLYWEPVSYTQLCIFQSFTSYRHQSFIGIESRPNVSIDAFSLAFKTNNAISLRGGRDAINSNKALVAVARKALENAGITADAVQLVEDTSHEVAEELMVATKYVDLLIPRGGARLIQTVKEKAKVPVIETGVGNCHIYVDKYANWDMATQIVINAKTDVYKRQGIGRWSS